MRHVTPLFALATLGLAPARSIAAQQRDSAVPATAAAPPATVTLIGRVVDEERCTPLAGAKVQVSGLAPITTDAEGRFRFAAAPAGSLEVQAQRVGYEQVSDTVAVEPPALAYAELRLRQGRLTNDRVVVDVERVTTVPARPRQGTMFRLRAVATRGDNVGEGTLAGERLHFRRVAPRTFEALAAAPVDAPDTLVATIAGRRMPVAIARGDFPVERLRVAPEFGREPDLALAERLERESEKARDVGCRAHSTPRLWTKPFVRPRPGRVTSTFGRAREYNGTVTGRHSGTDFAGATGTPVRAVNRGVVRLAERFYLGGNVVYVDHGQGLVSAYMHLSRTDVAVGDTVARGQVIGGVGSTGRVTGPHLHWVVRYGRTSVDPMSLLAIAGSQSGGARSQEPRAKRD